ncbi:hypothetical protein S40293_02029 [Stachybotrys chartarum IBT 40293]|nr:hypothetical protein S40293_02029 [Stachybotrys chartarum IBT 40293]
MLVLHQVGSVKIGEVVRYTLTYLPSHDRILPPAEKLHVRIRNTSAIALRAAFVHGPYNLSVAAYPSNFNPNEKFQNPRTYGVPEFEPMLKAGGSWQCELVVPEKIRQAAGTRFHRGMNDAKEHDLESASWIIEVSSQVIFSTSAAVGYELVVARDKKSLSLSQSVPVLGSQAQVSQPGKVSDLQQSIGAHDGHHPAQPKGVFSRAVHLKVEDTATLWNTPRLPGWDDPGQVRPKKQPSADLPVESVVNTGDPQTKENHVPRKPKKVHLVVLTHGLHSNLGADMLYMKESIDAAAKQAKIDARARRTRERAARRKKPSAKAADLPTSADANTGDDAAERPGPGNENEAVGEDDAEDHGDGSDDEEVIVRGYSGNATKTEKGIKYLGKRLARYVLHVTYPDQPYMPIGKGMGDDVATHPLKTGNRETELQPIHKHSVVVFDNAAGHHSRPERPYKITSISFIAHSLGGLIQTYAIAYIQKHSPQFFDLIKPINFIALASPFLGLSNENPLYVKFALDFGLVGRTGQDLGLTWRAPTLARSGWGALVGNLGEAAHKKVYGETQPESKPLMRILPTGPAHTALKKFRSRTVYSNVVNDGIVPLRTSCLLFLDWQGLGRVEKARRDAGLVETMVGFGWAEITGANVIAPRQKQQRPLLEDDNDNDNDNSDAISRSVSPENEMREVPQPPKDAVVEDERASIPSVATTPFDDPKPSDAGADPGNNSHPLAGFFNLFKSNEPPKSPTMTHKQKKIYHMSQTKQGEDGTTVPAPSDVTQEVNKAPKVTSGHELGNDVLGAMAPPTTTFFESAGDLLNPKVPDMSYILDPSKRPRAIFHDRVYHPSDIPPPPLKKRASSFMRRNTLNRIHSISHRSVDSGSSSPYTSVNHEDSMRSTKDYDDTAHTNPDKHPDEVVDSANMRVEEKIARGYHKDLSWRKVLVKLEPDAHNNIFVRRTFVNAYGWPVIKHLVDAHFSDSADARGRDEDEHSGERALDMNQPPDAHGGETKADAASTDDGAATAAAAETAGPKRDDEAEARDKVPELPAPADLETSAARSPQRPAQHRCDSMSWSDHDWADSDLESDLDSAGESKAHGTGKETPAGEGWNWTEKIVGKGTTNRAKSPVNVARPT